MSCANTGQKNLQQGEPQKQLVEKETVNSLLKDSVYCTELFRNNKLVSWAIPDFDVQPIITITENHFSYDQDLNGAHLYGQLKDERKFHGKRLNPRPFYGGTFHSVMGGTFNPLLSCKGPETTVNDGKQRKTT